MANEDLAGKLFEKMAAEQDKYRDWLLGQPPTEILNHAAEYTVREDILMEMEGIQLPEEQARALLASPDTMADVYKSYSKMMDTGHMDVVRESIEEEAHRLIESGILDQRPPVRQEGVYLVGSSTLLHLKEMDGADFAFIAFDKQSRQKNAEGVINADAVMDGVDPAHDFLAAARDAALLEMELDGSEVAKVGLTSLKEFRESDIWRRGIWEPETLPKDDIRLINSRYDEQFRIPNGGTVEVEYPDRAFSAKCGFIDEYHAYIGSEVFHMCQFAEVVERGGGTFRPEPELAADWAAWRIGSDKFLTVECGAGQWDYHIYDEKMAEIKGGFLEVVGLSINEVRDMILEENNLGQRSMYLEDFDRVQEKAQQRRQEVTGEKRESVLGQLSSLKSSQKEATAPAPAKKKDEVSL